MPLLSLLMLPLLYGRHTCNPLMQECKNTRVLQMAIFLLDLAISDTISLGFLEKERGKLERIAFKNQLKFEVPGNKIKIGLQKIFLKLKQYYMEWTGSVFINISEYKIENIFEASIKHNEIYQNYHNKLKVIVHNFVLLLKHAL